MSVKYEFKEQDFEHPSALFVFEDKVKSLVGSFLWYNYNSYFKTFNLKGTEAIVRLWLWRWRWFQVSCQASAQGWQSDLY